MHDESCDLRIIDFYYNGSALLIFVVINLTLSVLNMIHIFIWHKWNKIIWIETTKKRKIFFPWNFIFLYLIDLDDYYDKSMYTILNLLKVMLRFWWIWWFEWVCIQIMILNSWIYYLRFFNHDLFFVHLQILLFIKRRDLIKWIMSFVIQEVLSFMTWCHWIYGLYALK